MMNRKITNVVGFPNLPDLQVGEEIKSIEVRDSYVIVTLYCATELANNIVQYRSRKFMYGVVGHHFYRIGSWVETEELNKLYLAELLGSEQKETK